MHLLRHVSFSLLVSLVLCVPVAKADILSPPGLNPGDQYRIVFVTDAGRQESDYPAGTTDGIEHLNSFVANEATAAGSLFNGVLNTTWHAIASTGNGSNPGTDAIDNTASPISTPSVSLWLPDGTTKIADSYADFWDGSIDAPINMTAFGSNNGSTFVWTGTSPFGTSANRGLNTSSMWFGHSGSSNTGWSTDSFTSDQSQFYAMYGMSGVLTVNASVPEPGSAGLAWLAGTAICFFRRRS